MLKVRLVIGMKVIKRSDGWWIVGVPEYKVDGVVCAECGPYVTKAEADSDMRGMQRVYDSERE